MFNFSISWLIFWIFPYGMVAKDVNLADIKATEVKSKNQIFPLLLGIVLIVLGILSTMNDGVALGILAIIIGIILGGAGFKARLVLTTTQGTVNLDAVAFQKDVLLQIAQEIKNRQTKPEPQIKDNQVLEEL